MTAPRNEKKVRSFDVPGARHPVRNLDQLEYLFRQIGMPMASETLWGARNGLFIAQQLVGLRADVQALTVALRMKAAARRIRRQSR